MSALIYQSSGVSSLTATGFPDSMVSVDALKSNTVDLSNIMMIQVKGTGGDIKFTPAGTDTALTLAFAAGEWIPCKVKRVWSTGTTATTLIGVY